MSQIFEYIETELYLLEWQTDGEVEGEVTIQIRMSDRVVLTSCFVGWVDGFHTSIEANDKEIEVQTQTDAVAEGDLLEELVETEFSFWLVLVLTDSPDVSSVNEKCSIEFPKEEGSILYTEIELDVSTLVQEVDLSVCSLVGAWTE